MRLEDVSAAVHALLNVGSTRIERFKERVLVVLNLWVTLHLVAHLLDLLYLVHFFNAVETDANTIIIRQVGHLHEVLRAFAADGHSTLATMVLRIPKAEVIITDIARDDFRTNPVGSLSYLKVLDPAVIGAFANVSLSDRHADEGHLHMFTHISAAGYLASIARTETFN